MSSETIRIITGAEETRRILLQRQGLDEYQASPELRQAIERLFGAPLTPDEVVARILQDVRTHGDRALYHYAELLEGSRPESLRVPPERIQEAWETTHPALQEALLLAAERIRAFHQRQPRQSWLEWEPDGSALGQIFRPLDRIGIYAPHGTAAYPSSLLMAAIPARVAGVPEIAVATPPRHGALSQAILAAAHVAGITEVYAIGGAQAIAALAYGTETIPRVDKILGPGNIFVVLAKRRVYGHVGIDGLPGPTETLLIADETATPAYVAADLLAQAEHDALASAILLTPSERLARAVQREVERQIALLPRQEIIRAALAARGGIGIVADLEEAVALANEYAPEHLCLLTAAPWTLVGNIRHAGGIFVGEMSSEALGDYVVGPSHIMPTGRTARFASPVNVWDFLKITSIFGVSAARAEEIGPAAITLAQEEGLEAHATAVRIRLKGSKS